MSLIRYSWVDLDGWQSRLFASAEEARRHAVRTAFVARQGRDVDPVDHVDVLWPILETCGWQVVEHADGPL